MFRGFIRTQYKSLPLLVRAGQWEDAIILGRTLYELDLNLSKISDQEDPEASVKWFVKFGKFQLIRLNQKRIEDRLHGARLESQVSLEITNWKETLDDRGKVGVRIRGISNAQRLLCRRTTVLNLPPFYNLLSASNPEFPFFRSVSH